jgi:TrmH family RNA methyltransferase
MIEEAYRHTKVHTIIVEDEKVEHFSLLLSKLDASGALLLSSPRRVLESLCKTNTPQGIVAEVSIPVHKETLGERLVALDDVQDPGNVGTIVRTIDAVGFQGVLIGPACADPFGCKALRAGMGSIFRVPVFPVARLSERLMALREDGYAIVSSQLDGGDFFARGFLPPKLVLVIGSEAEGVNAAVSAVATHRLRLPMCGGAESLNAAIAAGIMLYDLARERKETHV